MLFLFFYFGFFFILNFFFKLNFFFISKNVFNYKKKVEFDFSEYYCLVSQESFHLIIRFQKQGFFRPQHGDCWKLRANALHIVKQLRSKYNLYTSPPILMNSRNGPYEIIDTRKEFEWFNNKKIKPKFYQQIHQAISITLQLEGTRDINLLRELRNERSNLLYSEQEIVELLKLIFNYCEEAWIRNFFGVNL